MISGHIFANLSIWPAQPVTTSDGHTVIIYKAPSDNRFSLYPVIGTSWDEFEAGWLQPRTDQAVGYHASATPTHKSIHCPNVAAFFFERARELQIDVRLHIRKSAGIWKAQISTTHPRFCGTEIFVSATKPQTVKLEAMCRFLTQIDSAGFDEFLRQGELRQDVARELGLQRFHNVFGFTH